MVYRDDRTIKNDAVLAKKGLLNEWHGYREQKTCRAKSVAFSIRSQDDPIKRFWQVRSAGVHKAMSKTPPRSYQIKHSRGVRSFGLPLISTISDLAFRLFMVGLK